MKQLFIILFFALLGVGVQAQRPARVPAYRGIIKRVQPDGDTIRTFLRGDEHMHWMMTEDGWQIVQNKKGWYVYAVKGTRVKASCRKVRNIEKRSQSDNKWLTKKGIKKHIS